MIRTLAAHLGRSSAEDQPDPSICAAADDFYGESRVWDEIPEVDACFKLAMRAVYIDRMVGADWELHKAFKACESPIEKMMLGAMTTIGFQTGLSVHIRLPNTILGLSVEAGAEVISVTITPQYVIDEFRVDFMLKCVFSGFDDASVVRELNVVVECDGHDYHERTPEQAERDKRRDRHLQACGLKTFHFTGREITRDCWKCAQEIFDYFTIEYEKLAEPQPSRPA